MMAFNMDAASALDSAATQLLGVPPAGRMIEVNPDTFNRWYIVAAERGVSMSELIVLGLPVRAVETVPRGEARIRTNSEEGTDR